MSNDPSTEERQTIRVDKWLWYARFFKTRTLASKFVESGKIRRTPETPPDAETQRLVKPNQSVTPGDVLTFPLGPHIRIVKIIAIGTRRGPAPEAQGLYEDLSPPVAKKSEAPIEPKGISAGRRPTKKERRALSKLKDPT